MFTIRHAVDSDADTVFDHISRTRDEFREKGIDMWTNIHYPCRDTVSEDISSGCAYVAECDGEYAGYVFLQQGAEPYHDTIDGSWRDSNPLLIHRLMVEPRFRRTGLGTMLMEFGRSEAVRLGFTSLRVETGRDNTPMRNLLEGMGFTESGTVQTYSFRLAVFEKIL